jgi:hypothetical protein
LIAHYWMHLPGPHWFSGAAIYAQQVALARNGAVFVELGSWKGRSTCFMGVEIANSGKHIGFHAVDHWLGSDEPAHDADADAREGRLFDVFLQNIEPVKDYVRPVRGDSATAAAEFADESVDFVYVDAEHTFAGVSRDMDAWWPKLKPGGVMAGDDWCFKEPGTRERGVRRAVREFCARRALQAEVHCGSPRLPWLQWVLTKPARPA